MVYPRYNRLIHAGEGFGHGADAIAVDDRAGPELQGRSVCRFFAFVPTISYCQMFYAGIFVRSLRIATDQGRLLLHQPSLGVAFAGLVDAVSRVAQQRRADSSSVINCKLQILVQHQARSRTLRVKAVPHHHGKPCR